EPQAGGTLNYYTPPDWPTLDPTVLAGLSIIHAARFIAIYDALVLQDPTTGELVYRVAESIESPDTKVWTIKLRPGVKFSDGTDFDAAAVKAYWDRTADP